MSPPRMRCYEWSIYAAGALVTCIIGVAPGWLWTFDVPGAAPRLFSLLVVLVLGARALARQQLDGAHVPHMEVSIGGASALRANAAIFLVAGAGLWMLRSSTLYGDGRAIIQFLSEGVLFHKREPLSPTIFLAAHRIVGEAFSWPPMLTIQVVNTIGGALGVVGLVAIARRLVGGDPTLGVCAAVMLASSGGIQLFAGHVENYALPTVCMLGSVVMSLDALAGRRGVVPAVALWTASCLLHLSSLVFAPAILWLIWSRRDDLRAVTVLRILAVTLVPAAVVYALMATLGFHRAEEAGFGGGDGHMFVPLLEHAGASQYLFLRPDHLVAIANVQLLVAPLALVVIVVNTPDIIRQWTSKTQAAPIRAQTFLLLVGLCFLGLTVVWNPDLGARQDWDLFAPVGFYLNVAAVAVIANRLRQSPRRLMLCLLFVASVNLSRSLPFVLHNALG